MRSWSFIGREKTIGKVIVSLPSLNFMFLSLGWNIPLRTLADGAQHESSFSLVRESHGTPKEIGTIRLQLTFTSALVCIKSYQSARLI